MADESHFTVQSKANSSVTVLTLVESIYIYVYYIYIHDMRVYMLHLGDAVPVVSRYVYNDS